MNAIVRVQLDHASDKHVVQPNGRDYRRSLSKSDSNRQPNGQSEVDREMQAYLNTYALFEHENACTSTADARIHADQKTEINDIDFLLLQCISSLFGGQVFARTYGHVTIIQVILPIEPDSVLESLQALAQASDRQS